MTVSETRKSAYYQIMKSSNGIDPRYTSFNDPRYIESQMMTLAEFARENKSADVRRKFIKLRCAAIIAAR